MVQRLAKYECCGYAASRITQHHHSTVNKSSSQVFYVNKQRTQQMNRPILEKTLEFAQRQLTIWVYMNKGNDHIYRMNP